MNCKHELILIRSNTVTNSVINIDDNDTIDFHIDKLQWRVPHLKVTDRERLALLKLLENDRAIQMVFRNWDLYEYPL